MKEKGKRSIKENEQHQLKKAHDLDERVKELNCIIRVFHLIEDPEKAQEELLQSIVEEIPSSWQYPESASARMILGDQIFKTTGFIETQLMQSVPIITDKVIAGSLEVCYTSDVPVIEEDVFLKEEYDLLESISRMVGRYLDRKYYEAQLREREESLRITLNSIGDGVISTDLKGCVTNLNPIAEELTGWKIEEALGKPITEVFNIVHALTDERAENPVEKVLEKSMIVGLANHTKLIAKDGREYQIADSAAPIKDRNDHSSGVVMVFRDVTESYRIREELKLSEGQLRKAQAISHTGSWQFFLDTGIVKASDEARRLYGLDKEGEYAISDVQKLPLPAHRELLDRALKKLISGEEKYDIEFEIKRADGSIVDIHSIAEYDAKENRVTGFIHDITDKKHAEQQLKLLSQSVEQNPVVIVITGHDGNIQYVNPAFTKITGYSLDEVKGENPRILQSGYHSTEFYRQLWNTILSGESWKGTMRNRKKNGDFYWEEAIISAIQDEHGEITHFVAVKEDITERKRLMEDLVIAKEKAEESDRLKSAFLANMSHEIRTPMNGILGFTGLLRNPDLSSEKAEKYIEIIHLSGQRMLNTVNDIVEISKIEAGIVSIVYEEGNLKERVEEIVRFFYPETKEKGITLTLNHQSFDDTLVITTDLRKFDAIFINLLKNAVKFTEKGEIQVGCIKRESLVEFYVKDSGIGIPKSLQEAVFMRFEQADSSMTRNFEGSGLGLAISKSYIELLGGSIRVESEEGIGSTFYFTLPIEPENGAKGSEAEKNR